MKQMLFGTTVRQVLIPYPETGMGFGNNVDSEVTELLSGGRHVYRAPTTFKTFNMSWRAGTEGLQPLIDMYNGVYGPGPFYMTDPLASAGNMLPPRWASAYQLGHIANGWCVPSITSQTNTPEGSQVTFTGGAKYADEKLSIVVPVIAGLPVRFKAWGTFVGAAGIRVYTRGSTSGTWTLQSTQQPQIENAAAVTVATGAASVDFIRLALYVPTGTSLTLQHMDLSTTDYLQADYPYRGGQGVGALQFTNRLDGSLTSTVVDRIGLSVDLTEVEKDANFS